MTAPTHRLSRETIVSPIGVVVLLSDECEALRAIDFEDCAPRMNGLLDRYCGLQRWRVSQATRMSGGAHALAQYFAGSLGAIDSLAISTGGTPFQRNVWSALRALPAGETLAYGALAARLGRPQASRAVGFANGSNPLAIVVPCHRLVGANGALTGYGGGLQRKRWLIDHEARHAIGGRIARDPISPES